MSSEKTAQIITMLTNYANRLERELQEAKMQHGTIELESKALQTRINRTFSELEKTKRVLGYLQEGDSCPKDTTPSAS